MIPKNGLRSKRSNLSEEADPHIYHVMKDIAYHDPILFCITTVLHMQVTLVYVH